MKFSREVENEFAPAILRADVKSVVWVVNIMTGSVYVRYGNVLHQKERN